MLKNIWSEMLVSEADPRLSTEHCPLWLKLAPSMRDASRASQGLIIVQFRGPFPHALYRRCTLRLALLLSGTATVGLPHRHSVEHDRRETRGSLDPSKSGNVGWLVGELQPLRYPNCIRAARFCHCACRKSNPNILVVQPAQDRAAKNGPGQFDGARDRRILLQR